VSYEYAGRIQTQLEPEVADLMAIAEAADNEPVVTDPATELPTSNIKPDRLLVGCVLDFVAAF